MIKIATWNVNSLRVRLGHVERFASTYKPDVLCLQETKLPDEHFPSDELRAMGFPHLAFQGQRAYNGVAILSRFPLTDIVRGFSVEEPDEQPRLLRATTAGIRVWSCYVPNGQAVGSDKFAYKLRWLSRLTTEVAASSGDAVICGDFNIAMTDTDVWDPFLAAGRVMYHPDEHKGIKAAIAAGGLVDALRKVQPKGTAFTWWDYQSMSFRKGQGYRIDHVYLTAALAEALREVKTCKDVRGWDQPSDHCPVVVSLEREPA